MRLAWMMIALAACGESREHCAARAHDLAVWADQVRIQGNGPQVAGLETLARVEAPPLDADLHLVPNVLELRGEGASYDGRPLGPDSLADRELRDPKHPARVVIAIDRDLPMRDVAPILDRVARAGLTDASFAVVRRATMKAPPRSSISLQIDMIAADPDVANRPAHLAKLVVPVVKPCQALDTLFGSVSADDDKARTLVAGLEPALTDCGCASDLDALRSILWAVLGTGTKTGAVTTAIAVTLAPSDDPTATAITGATWADAAPALLAAKGTRVKLVASAPSR